jgi:hypothetical protein
MLGRAFLFGLFYQALVIATVHRLKQAKTKNHQFSFGFYLDGQAAPCPFLPDDKCKLFGRFLIPLQPVFLPMSH